MRVLVAAVLVHSAAGMPARLIAEIQRVVLDAKAQSRHRVLQPRVLREGAPLAARGAKLLDGDAHRNAGAAVIAVGPVGKDAAAAKAEAHEVRVQLGADQVAGSRHLRARHPARQIAAGVGCSHVELQYGMRQIVQLRHCTRATDALQVARAHLTVDKPEPGRFEMGDESRERDLRGIADAGEHRLAEKHPADRHAVQSSREIPVDPGFDRMRVSEPVQAPVGLDHCAAYPGAGLALAGRGAAGKDFVEGRIEARFIGTIAKGFPERARNLELRGKQDHARIRAPP